VGGASLNADADGNYQSETVWNGFGATGGGVSQQFAEPSYQSVLPSLTQALLAKHRGVPDVAYNSDPVTGIAVFVSFLPGINTFALAIGGTSAASPQWAGIAAIANQRAGRPLGFLNRKLYRMAAKGRLGAGFHDVTVGNNSFGGVPGFDATAGWDATTGWGTPNATELILRLVDEADDDDDGPQ
jgi:subtilase family serine protease